MIKAPFNFVPLSDQVFFPDWADQISHDIPFEDGVSGTITLKITAESPIFVRNGHTKADAKNDEYKSFAKTPDGKYFIPATSIKGAIRNVLEIISFGKMNKLNNKRYSIRDLKLTEYLSYFQNNTIHCGWMTLNDNVITIQDCGEPYRISHKNIDFVYGTNLVDTFTNGDNFKKNSDKYRSALYKINLFRDKNKTTTFLELKQTNPNPVDKRKFAIISPTTDGFKGTIVFTGQPGIRKPGTTCSDGTKIKGSGKFFEFVFPEQEIGSYTLSTDENSLYEDFCFVYKDSQVWAYWKNKMEKGEKVPVFFSSKNGKIEHFGLSYLYKLPYIYKIKDYLSENHKKNDKDLPECIFGTSDGSGLRGRVAFGHAFCTTEKEYYNGTLYPYMGCPRPTYYPMYLQQEGTGGQVYTINAGQKPKNIYATMLSPKAKLKGFKRYPVQKHCIEEFEVAPGQEDNTNPFIPLGEGSEFECVVRFHNLKRIELAALVSAIHLGKGSFHSIGFAKPFGYGKCTVEIINIDRIDTCVDDLKKEFKEFMNTKIDKYGASAQIREFNTMVHDQNLRVGASLSYMSLSDFPSCKQNGEYLQLYSEYVDKPKPETSVVKKEAIATVSMSDKKKAYIGADMSKLFPIEFSGNQVSLKSGDKINVSLRIKDGKTKGIVFVSKV